MRNPLSKTPFLLLLIPLITGILLQYYLQIEYLSIAFFFTGFAAMLFSYMINEKYQFRFRWLFGAGASLFIIGVAINSTAFRQKQTDYIFSGEYIVYKGLITDSPQEKPRTTAYNAYLPEYDRHIVCYFQKDTTISNQQLHPGDEFLFQAKIQPIKNMGNPDDFDYTKYMHDKGFSGSAYITNNSWIKTGITSSSLKYRALNCRQYILDFYNSLGFTETEYAILSALTLGYKDALTDDLQESFRTTGTVHILSVSGLHVGIIFIMINFLLGFIRKNSKYFWIRPVMTILLLWIYAFITGLPISVIRASIMLTIFCVSQIAGKRNYSPHALFIAAFFILLANPFSLFDIGFQLSFMSVLSILYLQPKASGLLKTDNKYLNKGWQMFTISIVAQLATFPICLYYFGTFPTYFFVANMLVVPLVSLIIYSAGAIIIVKLISIALPDPGIDLYYIPVEVLRLVVKFMTTVINFIEKLPFASIKDINTSFSGLILIYTIIIGILLFLIYKKAKALILALSAILLLVVSKAYENMETKPNTFIVYNRNRISDIRYSIGNQENKIFLSPDNEDFKITEAGNSRILILNANLWTNKETTDKFEIDNLILTANETISLYSLTQILSPRKVILDSSLSAYTRRRLTKECQNLNIPFHDVVENGAFTLIF